MLRCSGRRAARPPPARCNGPGIPHRGNGPGIPHRGIGGASRPDRGRPTVAPSAAAAAAAVAQPSQAGTPSPEDRFGLRVDPKEQKTGELTELSATATAISAKPRGELVITLDNGQVWGEIAPGSKIKVKPGDAVKIEAGTLGSFILIAPNGRSSKVTRIR